MFIILPKQIPSYIMLFLPLLFLCGLSLEKILSLPMEIQKIILEKCVWLSDIRHIYDIPLAPINNNRVYFGGVRYPYHRLVYFYDPNMRWIDYYAIIQYARAYERVSIIMYYEDIMSPFSHWSSWMNLLLVSFVPRKEDQGNLCQQFSLSILYNDMQDGVERYDIFEFYLLYKGTNMKIN